MTFSEGMQIDTSTTSTSGGGRGPGRGMAIGGGFGGLLIVVVALLLGIDPGTVMPAQPQYDTQGVEAPNRSVPAWLAGGGAAIAEATWRLLRLGGEPPLTRLAVWLSSQECTIEIGKARRELGYEPVISRQAGLAAIRAG